MIKIKNILIAIRFAFSDEISRQLKDSNTKVLFGLSSMSSILIEAVAKTKLPIRIVYTKETEAESIPAGGIYFNELVSTQGWTKSLELFYRFLNFPFLFTGIDLNSLKPGQHNTNGIAMLPYSR